jgi:hypothetical protein
MLVYLEWSNQREAVDSRESPPKATFGARGLRNEIENTENFHFAFSLNNMSLKNAY